MTTVAPTRLSLVLPLIAAVIVAIVWGLFGQERGVAALVGASLSVANWFALRFLAARVTRVGGEHAGMMLLLVAKMGVLMLAVFVLLNRFHLDPIGLVLGLSVLFIGPVLGALAGSPSTTTPTSPASEER